MGTSVYASASNGLSASVGARANRMSFAYDGAGRDRDCEEHAELSNKLEKPHDKIGGL